MKAMIALSLVGLAMAFVAPAVGEPEQKTELVRADGQRVDVMPLYYQFSDTWVIDAQNVLWRDDSRDYYLVTLKDDCAQLEERRPFQFHPGNPWRLSSDRSYEIRPQAGPFCKVSRITQVDDTRGAALRESALRRVWR